MAQSNGTNHPSLPEPRFAKSHQKASSSDHMYFHSSTSTSKSSKSSCRRKNAPSPEPSSSQSSHSNPNLAALSFISDISNSHHLNPATEPVDEILFPFPEYKFSIARFATDEACLYGLTHDSAEASIQAQTTAMKACLDAFDVVFCQE
jgi:hypothetical protein